MLGANSYVCRSYSGKTGRECGVFFPPPPSPPSCIGLIRQVQQNSALFDAIGIF